MITTLSTASDLFANNSTCAILLYLSTATNAYRFPPIDGSRFLPLPSNTEIGPHRSKRRQSKTAVALLSSFASVPIQVRRPLPSIHAVHTCLFNSLSWVAEIPSLNCL